MSVEAMMGRTEEQMRHCGKTGAEASAAIENELKAIGEPVWWPTTSCAPGIFLRRSRH